MKLDLHAVSTGEIVSTSDDELKAIRQRLDAIYERQIYFEAALQHFIEHTAKSNFCKAILVDLEKHLTGLSRLFPDWDKTLKPILSQLVRYTYSTFKSVEDMSTLEMLLAEVLGIAESLYVTGKEAANMRTGVEEIKVILDELYVLENGGAVDMPAAEWVLRNLDEGRQNFERIAVRERAVQRSADSIKRIFEKRSNKEELGA